MSLEAVPDIYMMSLVILTDRLVKVVFARFLYCKVTSIFPFPYFIFGSDSLNSCCPQSGRGIKGAFLSIPLDGCTIFLLNCSPIDNLFSWFSIW